MRLRDNKTGYDYIFTYVNDFKVLAKNISMWINNIASAFIVKEHGLRNYYLGNDYIYHRGQDMCTYG